MATFSYDVALEPKYIDFIDIGSGYGILSIPIDGFLPEDAIGAVTLVIAPRSGSGDTISKSIDMVQRTDGYFEYVSQSEISAHFTLTADDLETINAGTYGYTSSVIVTRSENMRTREVQAGNIAARPAATIPPLMVASIEITGGPITGDTGDTGQLTAEAFDAYDNEIAGQILVWASANPLVAQVDQSGLVTFLIPGTTTITASAQGIQASTTATAQDPAFDAPTDGQVAMWDAGDEQWRPTTITPEVLQPGTFGNNVGDDPYVFQAGVEAESFSGDGAGLTGLSLDNFTTGLLPVPVGGTGLSTFGAIGAILYASGAIALAALAGNTTATKKFLTQTGNGSASAAPTWAQPVAADISDLATAATGITRVGTVTVGVWQGTAIVDTYLAQLTTAGKVANSATTAASANTASAIVARDGSGNFAAGVITASLVGSVTGNVTGNLTGNVNGDVTGNVTGSVTGNVVGNVTGNLTGNVSGNVDGNADTATLADAATALATPRTINGVAFNGTADITVTAAAGTLTGATLNSGVTASSLTSVGTLTSLAVAGGATVGTTLAVTGAVTGASTGKFSGLLTGALGGSFAGADPSALYALGITAPGAVTPLHVLRAGGNPNILLAFVGSTFAAPTGVSNGNTLGGLIFGGYDGVSALGSGAAINGLATETWSNTARGAKLVFQTRANTTTTAQTVLTLDQDKSATFTGTGSFTGALTALAGAVVRGTPSAINEALRLSDGVAFPTDSYKSSSTQLGMVITSDSGLATITGVSNVAGGMYVRGIKYNGNIASPTAVIGGNTLVTIEGSGFDGTNWEWAWPPVSMFFYATGNWSATSHPTGIFFQTTPVDSVDPRSVVFINQNGDLRLDYGYITLNGVQATQSLSADGAVLYASADRGATILGHGTTYDVSLTNRAGGVVLGILHNTDTLKMKAALTSADHVAVPSALAAVGLATFASNDPGAVLMGYGDVFDVTLMNRAGTPVLGIKPNTTTVSMVGLVTTGALATPAGALSVLATAPDNYLAINPDTNTNVARSSGLYMTSYGKRNNIWAVHTSGTVTAPTATSGIMFQMGVAGWDTAAFGVGALAQIVATETWAVGAHGSKWVFHTVATGATAGALAMTIDQDKSVTVVGKFGCNGATAQAAVASGGALAAYGAGANGLDSGANMAAMHALVVAMRAALVANGVMS